MKKIFSAILFAGLLFGANSCKNQGSETHISSMKEIEAAENLQAGEKYVAEQLKSDTAFVKTESGLCYKVLNEGEGENFTDNDVVDVIYVGKHINGEEFDNSKGEVVPFDLHKVIPGFSEVIKLMKPGSKVLAIIPSNIGYGEQGTGPIGPNETLVFEITTVGVHKQ